jgi:hypothetical protein
LTGGSGPQTGGVPVLVQNIANNTTQSGVFNTVNATTTVVGNNNSVAQSVSNVGNNATVKGKTP